MSGIDGAPLRYRVWHLAEQLAAAGAESRVLYHSDVGALEAARGADLVVLSRAPFGPAVAAVVAEARRRRVPVVFSVDDLVFSATACDAPALRDDRPAIAEGFRSTLDGYARSFAAADCFLGNTEELLEVARESGVPAYLHRNGLGSPLLARAERARARRVRERGGRRRAEGGAPVAIGFLSGTDTHGRDLALVAPALSRVLARFPQARLAVGGHVKLPRALAALGDRVEHWPWVPWSELAERLASLDVCLAPLELPSRFNEAKSELKYLEAAAVDVPTVASPSRPFRLATQDGMTGLLARSVEDWEDSIGRLVADAELRERLGRAARRDVYRRYGPLVQGGELHEIVAEILARGPRRPAPPPPPIPMEAGGGSTVALEPPDAVYDAWQLDAESGGPLGPGREIEQTIACRSDGVWRIDVLVGTYARRNDCAVTFTVLDDVGQVRGRRVVSAATLLDRSFVAIELARPIAHSAGRTLSLRAEAPDAGPGNEILLWQGPARAPELRVGGELVPGRSVVFRSFGEAAR